MLTKIHDSYIYELRSYLSDTSWNNFMKTTKKYSNINKITRNINLNIKYSELYYESNEFRNIINSKIVNTNNQLSLNLRKCINNNNITNIFNINKLKLYFSTINNIAYFKNIKILDLTVCCNVTDISSLHNIENINLSYCYNISDISSLKKCKKVVLSYCYNIKDITPLINVQTIFISYCNNIHNIEPLKNVNYLYISLCEGIKYVELLYTVKYLYIHLCHNIIDMYKLKEKKKENLSIF